MKPTCGTCKNWHDPQPNPQDLREPRQGECRAAPPVVLTAVQGGQIMNVYQYMRLPANFRACALYVVDLQAEPETPAEPERKLIVV